MIKLFAATITIVSGLSFGASLSKEEKRKIDNIEDLAKLFSYIHFNIEKHSLPLNEIFSNFLAENKEKEIAHEISKHFGTYGQKIMKLSEKSCSQLLCMEIKDFAESLGTVDRETQIIAAKEACDAINRELFKKREEYLTKSRLYKTLSLLASCVIAVLLY